MLDWAALYDTLLRSRGSEKVCSMGRTIRQFGGAFALAVGASAAGAHPGHGETDPSSPLHAAEPVHLLPVMLIALLVGGVILGLRQLTMKRSEARNRK